MTVNYYKSKQTPNQWIKTIEDKFSDISLTDRVSHIFNVLSPNDKELSNIEKASLIVYGKSVDVTTFEDACTKLALDIPNFNDLTKDEIAYKKLKIIVKALNDGWEPNWGNSNEYKWYPWFDMINEFSFSDTNYYCYAAISIVGSRLCLKSKDLAEYIGKMFIDLYEDLLVL